MENLATDIFRSLIKVIIALIITNILTIFGFLLYLSLPTDYEQETITQQAEDTGINSYIGGNYNGEASN